MNRRLKFILISNTIFVFAGSLFAPLYAIFVLSLDGNAELAGILIAVQFLVSFLTGLFIVKLGDKSSFTESLLKTNFILRAIIWSSLAFFPSITTLFFCHILSGIAEAIGAPSFNSLVSENLDEEKHIKDWGYWELIKNPAISLASLLGGFIVTAFGFNMLFGIMAGLALVSLLVYQFTLSK